MMTDPIADMLSRIRNALMVERPYVDIPSSKVKVGIAQALQREGYIWDFEVIEEKPRAVRHDAPKVRKTAIGVWQRARVRSRKSLPCEPDLQYNQTTYGREWEES